MLLFPTPRPARSPFTAIGLMARIAAIMFILEAAIMTALLVWGGALAAKSSLSAFVDAAALVISSTPLLYVLVVRPYVVAREQAEENLRTLATHDALTSLPNRSLLFDRLALALGRARRVGGCLAVMFVDVDGFKYINDTFGHKVGDDLLKVIATSLRDCIRDTDTVARFGGDEFVVLLGDIAEKAAAGYVAQAIVGRVAQIASNLEFGEHLGVSVGIAFFPDHGIDVDQLVAAADVAMYSVKKGGKNNWMLAPVNHHKLQDLEVPGRDRPSPVT